MSYSISKFKDNLLTANGFVMKRYFVSDGKVKLIEVDMPKSGNRVMINIPDTIMMKDKLEEGIPIELFHDLGFVNPQKKDDFEDFNEDFNEDKLDLDNVDDGDLDKLLEEIDMELDKQEKGKKGGREGDEEDVSDKVEVKKEKKEKKEKRKEEILDKSLLEELEKDIHLQTDGKKKYKAPDINEEDIENEEKEKEEMRKEEEKMEIEEEKKKKENEKIDRDKEDSGDIIDTESFDEYDDVVYKNIGEGQKDIYEPMNSIDGDQKIELRKNYLQLKRFSKIVSNIDYELTRIVDDFILLTQSTRDGVEISVYNFKNPDKENSVFITIDFDEFVDDMDHIHKELPVILKHIYKILRRGVKIHAQTVADQIKNVKIDSSSLLKKIGKKDKELIGYIRKYKDLIDRLNNEEECILSRYKINKENQRLNSSSEIKNIFKTKDLHGKVSQIRALKRNISHQINSVENELDKLYLVADRVLYDNILLTKTYADNQVALNEIMK